MRLLVGVLGAFLTLSSAQAQQVGFRPDTETSTATLSVSSVSSSTSAGTALLALVCNTGANEAFVAIGASTVTATTSGMSFPAGFCTSLQLNRGNYIAAVTSSSTTTLRVTYGSGTPPIAGAGSGGGGGGGGAVTMASGAVASGAYSSGSIASGAVAAGAYASGAYAAGSIAAGAGVDGWDLTQGAKADAAWVSGSGSVISILKNIAGGIAGSIPAGTNGIGSLTAGTAEIGNVKNSGTFAVQAASTLAAETTKVIGTVRNADGAGVLYVSDPCSTAAKTTLPITLATAAVKVIATGVSAKKIYVCHFQLNNNAADSIAFFEATTGTTCVTSPIAVVGAGTSVATAATGYNFSANGGINAGTGNNQIHVTTVNNNDLCIAQSAATQLTGSITYVTQ